VSYGKVAVSVDAQEWDEITAPYTGITVPGTRRVLYIIEDCIWTTFHRIDGMKSDYNDLNDEEKEGIVKEIEEKILEPHLNYLTGYDMIFIAVALSVLAQAGDLLESYIKRIFDIKDSSTLIPGHGGVLDRMDSIVTTAPIMLLLIVFGVIG
jgi:CDP-diglyceride synthetase